MSNYSRQFVRSTSTLAANNLKIDFELHSNFVDSYRRLQTPFGFNGLGELVYLRTYARNKEDGSKERWADTIERVVNGTFRMQQRRIQECSFYWDEFKAQSMAQEMYDRMFNMKFLPPGRGLWAMGTPITEERGLFAALNNCAFVSTEDMNFNPIDPFAFLMDASMLGVGVGFDTRGAGKLTIQKPDITRKLKFSIPDSREGWVQSLEMLLHAYFYGKPLPVFDYSLIRPAGSLIRGFGGISQGSSCLAELHESIVKLFDPLIGQLVDSTLIVDLMNMIGKCVVSGNVRRTAEIAFGDPRDLNYIELKNYQKNPHRMSFGWTSNNSIFAELGMDYSDACERIKLNGEPGFAWLDNMRNYGRMNGILDQRDLKAKGGNPCLEQTLESFEICCLVETFPARHDTIEDFLETLKFAFLYAKSVTLGETHWPKTNDVLLRNRRIGCSMSGIAQFIAQRGLEDLRSWSEQGYSAIQRYDLEFSKWLEIPTSIKTTCIKPSGTVSLLAGATPGMHFPESRFYIRRVRLAKNSELIPNILSAGYKIEPAVHEANSVIVEIPVDVGENVRTLGEVSMWEQLCLASFLQRHWADNQVSCTVTFDATTEGDQVKHALDYFQYQLKGVSFFPRIEAGAYPQMPYEKITEEQYRSILKNISLTGFSNGVPKSNEHHEVPDKYCDSTRCSFDPSNPTDTNFASKS